MSGARVFGTESDAKQWEAFADELAGSTISIPADLAVGRVAAAARRVAARIRLALAEPPSPAGKEEP